MADCHVRARFAATKRVSVTNPIKKRKNNRRGRRGGKAKKAQKAKEGREAKEAKKVSRGTQSDLDTASGTSASGTAPSLTFIGEVLTQEEAEFLDFCLRQFRAPR
ncbi:hypothetical protein N7516_004570 [Penicillium verrucosum]|uniref:uncharacterized protein n=1 Tax=Penicillium verrucosum TaxID=60171 RepID=UPI0025458784|nr:uncharacterized protein N7516_004570 [Penicillium verrucosum]KAJ5944402.1 hypothetical protein N7516_004570 [Penicillium verrucosum]